MQLYLPIAELTVNMLLFLGMGGAVGFLSGMFGVGGGFLLTPLLIFTGIPPAVAVATVTPQIVASSTSAAISYWRRRLIDEKMTALLGAGGLVGSALGVFAFRALRSVGQLDLIIALAYVAFLGFIGTIMLRESVRALWRVALRPRRRRSRRPGHAQLDPRPAAEDALPPLEALCERDPGHRARLRHRLPRHGARHGRRLHHGAGADLSPARADQRRDRHVARLHADHHGGSRRCCTPRPTSPSTSCSPSC